MIISREFQLEDIGGINDIFEKQSEFGVPSLDNVIINSTLVDSDTGKIVGYGAVKLFAEALLLLDPELSKKHKVQGVREAMKTAIVFSRDAGLEYVYAIANTEGFSKVLRKSYGATEVSGRLLMIDLHDH